MKKRIIITKFYDLDDTLFNGISMLYNGTSPKNDKVFEQFEKDKKKAKKDKNFKVEILTCRYPITKKSLEKKLGVKVNTWKMKNGLFPTRKTCVDYKTKFLNNEMKKKIKNKKKEEKLILIDDYWETFDKKKLLKNIEIQKPNY